MRCALRRASDKGTGSHSVPSRLYKGGGGTVQPARSWSNIGETKLDILVEQFCTLLNYGGKVNK